MHPPRCESIGCRSEPYGPARVEVRDESGALVAEALTNTCNHCAISGLQAEHALHLYGDGQARSCGAAACAGTGIRQSRGWCSATACIATSSARCRIRTLPLDGAVLVRRHRRLRHRHPQAVDARHAGSSKSAQALERAVDSYDVRLMLTTGDNIYASKRFLLWTADSGDEDDDWFFTYFQPYRYVINRVPVCPSIGNHDTRETEEHDDREQVMDNFYLRERLAGEEAAGRASVSPGCSTGSASRPTSSSSASTRRRRISSGAAGSSSIRSTGSSCSARFRRCRPDGIRVAHSRSAIIRRSAPGRSITTPTGWSSWSRCSRRGGVRACFSGHEHNFQHSRWNGIDYFVTGAGSKIRRRAPRWFEDAHTETWSGECHFLLVTIDGRR